jgi:hypothetical protein
VTRGGLALRDRRAFDALAMPPAKPAAPEELRDGRFVVLGALGEGSQGRTYDGVDKREGRPVAIKRFDVRGAKQWKDVELAEREARVLAALSHPRLPAYVDHFEHEGALYLVMDRIDGESLASLRKRGAVLSEGDVVRLLHDAAEVLDYLHGRAPPVIHRDLKPGNVIRRPDGSYAFVDFGAVRDRLRPEGGSTVVGTFGYMAPEQFQGRALPQSDVYAIAATALTLLTGEEPEALPHKGLAIDVRAALRGRVSAGLVDALERMLDPDPDRRATRIAPLLAELDGRGAVRERAGGPRKARRDERAERAPHDFEELGERIRAEVEDRVRRQVERATRRSAPHEEREERAERWARREERRRARGSRGIPWPIALVLSLGLTVGIVAVWAALQIVVPTLLRFLSLFLGPKLREAAATVQASGRTAVESMRRAHQVVGGSLAPPREEESAPAGEAESRVRVEAPETEAQRRVRVAQEPHDARDARDLEADAAEAERAAEEAATEAEQSERETRSPAKRRR